MTPELRKRVNAQPVQCVRVTLACAVVGCAGLMEYAGEGFTQIETKWKHRCSMCEVTEWIENKKFPNIEHRF